MSLIGDGEVQLIITSPPYWQLKDYGSEDQIGFHDSYESYINDLNKVWAECYRVLSDGCRICINIGDQFARSVYYGRYKVIPIRTEIIKCCEALGMDYMGAIIWQKNTTMNTTGGGAVMGSFPYPRNGILKIDYEFILVFKKLGNPPFVTPEQKSASIMTREEWNCFFSSHWNFSGVKQDKHMAMFPEELPKRLIKMFSFAGETVFDPFLGSGTTMLAAKHLSRNSIGYEINPCFLPTIREKLGVDEQDLFRNDNVSVQYDREEKPILLDSIPYIFRDPHRFCNKVDVKKLTFGSKIDGTEETKKFFIVSKILSPEELELNNGVRVRLLGIKTNPRYLNEAMEYLTSRILKQQVFVRHDAMHHGEGDSNSVYLYLRNRTFVNNHLAKTGLVFIDTVTDYKYRNKFLQSNQGGRASLTYGGACGLIKTKG